MDLTPIHDSLQFLRDVLHSETPNKIEYCKAAVDDTIHELESLCAIRLDLSNETFEFRESIFAKPQKLKGSDLELMEMRLNKVHALRHSSTALILTEQLKETYTKKLIDLAVVDSWYYQHHITLAGHTIKACVAYCANGYETEEGVADFIAKCTYFYNDVEDREYQRFLLCDLARTFIQELDRAEELKND